MPGLVIDASVTLQWLFDEDAGRNRIRPTLESAELTAPTLWRLEVTNAVLVRERRGMLNSAIATRLLNALDDLPINLINESEPTTASLLAQTARPHQLTSYDAVYLMLAMRLGLPLLTADKNLLSAAKRVGVKLVRP